MLGACGLAALALALTLALALAWGGRHSCHRARLESRAVDRVLATTPYVTVGGRRRREVALTFDDGPGEYTPQIVAALRRANAPATFFEIGNQIADFRAATRLLVRKCFPIGDHTETHPLLAHHRHGFQLDQLTAGAAQLTRYGAPYPRLFRPPYGSFNDVTLRILRNLHMLMVLWTADTEDYAAPGVHKIVSNALDGLRPGAIILMHDGGGNRSQTVAALPILIRRLRARGYRLVSIPQMMRDDPPSTPQPIPDGTGPSATSS